MKFIMKYYHYLLFVISTYTLWHSDLISNKTLILKHQPALIQMHSTIRGTCQRDPKASQTMSVLPAGKFNSNLITFTVYLKFLEEMNGIIFQKEPQLSATCLYLEIYPFNPLATNGVYISCTAQLTSRHCILNIYSTNTLTEYFKNAAHSPFFFF